MPEVKLTAIVAAAENRVIGVNNTLPWHLSNDLKRFKVLTEGKPVLMGRNTFLSLPEEVRPLPRRENNVLSKEWFGNPDLRTYLGRIYAYDSLESALAGLYVRHPSSEIMVIGGESVYKATMGMISSLHLTTVHTHVFGEAFFPEIDRREWEVVSKEEYEDSEYLCTYEHLVRK